MTCKDDVDNWMSKLATSSNIHVKYNMESGGRSKLESGFHLQDGI